MCFIMNMGTNKKVMLCIKCWFYGILHNVVFAVSACCGYASNVLCCSSSFIITFVVTIVRSCCMSCVLAIVIGTEITWRAHRKWYSFNGDRRKGFKRGKIYGCVCVFLFCLWVMIMRSEGKRAVCSYAKWAIRWKRDGSRV